MGTEAAPGLAADLVAEHFGCVQGVMRIGGHSAAELATTFQTPLYVYDAAALRRSYGNLARALGGFAEIFYSIKANPNPHVARVLVSEGAGVEIASAAEYERARAAGCPAERVVFAGPGKSVAELEHVVDRGIAEIHVESISEIHRLSAVAARLGKKVGVAIRVNPGALVQGGAMQMAGRATQFGIDEEQLDAAADIVCQQSHLQLRGLHLFSGTQILDADVLARQWAYGLDLAHRFAARAGLSVGTIDLGGGLGVPYFAGDKPLDLGRLSAVAAELAPRVPRGTRVIVEPGRFLAGPAGVYLTRVIEAKRSRGERFVVVDGGMNHHLAASGNLGQVVKRDYPVVAATRMSDAVVGPAAIVGPLCTPLDMIARRAALPEVEEGDLIAVLQSGAYGLTASPVGFLSAPMPAEVLVDGESAKIVRPRGTFSQPMTALP